MRGMVRPPLQFAIRILVIGPASSLRERVAELLRRAGFAEVVAVEVSDSAGSGSISGARDLRVRSATFADRADIAVFVADGESGLDYLDGERRSANAPSGPWLDAPIPVVALPSAGSPPEPENKPGGQADGSEVDAWLAAGAAYVFRVSDCAEVLAARLRTLSASRTQAQTAEAMRTQSQALLRIHRISAEQGDTVEALRSILHIALEVMDFERASLIAYVEGSDAGYVIAATDSPDDTQFVVAIDKYPEVRAALNSRQPVWLDDAQNDPLTAPVADLLAQVAVRGIVVFPTVWMGTPLGAVLFRKSDPGIDHARGSREVFARTLAHHVAVCLQHGKVMESLRETTTHRLSRTRYEAERRLRTIESLKEHFEAAADSVIILDELGRILFVNQAAEATLGFSRETVMGTDIVSLVPPASETMVQKVVERVIRGQNIGAFDLDLLTLSGETICASVTTSTVLGTAGAAVLSFRDVTAQRALEAELRHTKEFLEKLVDSTVDAIVAADMRGNVIVFNQGAERMYGYAAEEVIGRIAVWHLYADGVARQIMRMLRSTQYGGVGRLEQTRREIKNKNGDQVPVNMTASIIYQDRREVATVGIFSDLRERIRIEQRLLQAQEKLQMTEKQALVAELAGAAAHELNQPLTSIMGYAELVLAKAKSRGEAGNRPVQVILSEAERMAEIVKKIGRLTKYETTVYVGSTRMIDLDRSSRASTADPAPLFTDASIGFQDGRGLFIEDADDGPAGSLHGFSDEDDDEVTAQVDLEELLRRGELRSKRSSAGDVASDVASDDDYEGDFDTESPTESAGTRPSIVPGERLSMRDNTEGEDER